LSDAIAKDLQSAVLEEERQRHRVEVEDIKKQLQEETRREIEQARLKASQQAKDSQALELQVLRDESLEDKVNMTSLREQLLQTSQQLREAKTARDNAEIDMTAKLTAEADKIREEAQRSADEKQRLNLAQRDKTISDLQKSLDDAQRRAAQGSQQLQGEVLELDLETNLRNEFRDDEVQPIAKGTRGGDILHIIRTPGGATCGALLWEVKRTKNWTDSWVTKLKDDLRRAKANIPIIVTEVMPKSVEEDIALYNGVWICKPRFALVLATLLRKGLLDIGLEKSNSENRGTKADALYNFVTSHEFVQQIEAMVETFFEMTQQITRERVQYAKNWSEREAQCQRLLHGTAVIMGSMKGYVGHSSMPQIKGLEAIEASEDNGAPEMVEDSK
jgi:hypothetical protein